MGVNVFGGIYYCYLAPALIIEQRRSIIRAGAKYVIRTNSDLKKQQQQTIIGRRTTSNQPRPYILIIKAQEFFFYIGSQLELEKNSCVLFWCMCLGKIL